MIQIRKANDRGHASHGWLDSYHSFSFADYYDPNWMGYHSLRVINDDLVMPTMGFGTHPHRDMEIITYVLNGELAHKDSMGNGRVIRPGEVQYMAAGKGIRHSEYNSSQTEPVHLLQIWITPDKTGAEPRYEEKSLVDAETGKFHLVTSKNGRGNSIAINQDADLWLGKFQEGEAVTHPVEQNRHVWLHVAEGDVDLNGQELQAGDAAIIESENFLKIKATKNAQVLLFDLN